jgi:hypothetical protein
VKLNLNVDCAQFTVRVELQIPSRRARLKRLTKTTSRDSILGESLARTSELAKSLASFKRCCSALPACSIFRPAVNWHVWGKFHFPRLKLGFRRATACCAPF